MFPFFCSPTLPHCSAPLASCGYCSHLDSRTTSPSLSVLCVSLQEGAPCPSFSLPFFSLCPPIPPTHFPSPCWFYSLCSSHFRLHSSLGNVDLFLTSSSKTGKEARPLEIISNLLPRNAWEWSGWEEEGLLIVFSFIFFLLELVSGKNGVIVHLFILCKSGAADLC